MSRAKGIFKPAHCKKHDWTRTAVFYATSEYTCTNCGKKKTVKSPLDL
jgi:predicted SprT family Zn-dependent metalloprotease